MHQDSDSFFKLKDAYTNFIISNTKINGKTETWRIFTKVLNPLAYMHNSCGSVRGLISKDVITFDILMYNRQNFRDLWCSKPKSLTRKEYAASHAKSAIDSSRTTALRSYLVNKAKKYVKQYNIDYNGGLPEISKYSDGTPGNHAHHIFPAELYPSISYYVENLICLSPNQHLYHAHPNNDTHRIDNDYQVLLLVAKSETIEKDYLNNRGFYDFDKFIFVLQTGYKDASFGSIHSLDFDSLRASIMRYYSTGC